MNDYHKFGVVLEGVAWIAELICYSAVVERLYLGSSSKAADELERGLVKLYASILKYLAKAKRYFEMSSTG